MRISHSSLIYLTPPPVIWFLEVGEYIFPGALGSRLALDRFYSPELDSHIDT